MMRVFTPSDFIAEIKEANLPCILLNEDSQPKLINAIPNHKPFGIYQGTDFTFALFNLPSSKISSFDDQNGTLDFLQIKTSLLLALVEMLALTQIYSMD